MLRRKPFANDHQDEMTVAVPASEKYMSVARVKHDTRHKLQALDQFLRGWSDKQLAKKKVVSRTMILVLSRWNKPICRPDLGAASDKELGGSLSIRI